MAAYSVSWGAHKGNHNMQTSRRGVRLEALDNSIKSNTLRTNKLSRISTRTLAWERPNERNNSRRFPSKFSYSRRYPCVFKSRWRRTWLARRTFRRDANSRNFDLKIAKQLSPSIGMRGTMTRYEDAACLPRARPTPM